jgi:cyclophilin family peptidyl-prolyl cis-trans isomerase
MGLAKDILKENKKILLLALALFVMSIIGAFLLNRDFLRGGTDIVERPIYTQPEEVIEEGVDYSAIIKTEIGDIEIELYEDQSPDALNSFIFLSKESFYDGLTFHRVVPNLVIQAGDHLGNGEGDPGYEINTFSNRNLEIDDYTVCMVNASQFFITVKGAQIDNPEEYPIIGRVTSGYAVVDTIEKVEVDNEYRPKTDITIKSIDIIE